MHSMNTSRSLPPPPHPLILGCLARMLPMVEKFISGSSMIELLPTYGNTFANSPPCTYMCTYVIMVQHIHPVHTCVCMSLWCNTSTLYIHVYICHYGATHPPCTYMCTYVIMVQHIHPVHTCVRMSLWCNTSTLYIHVYVCHYGATHRK